MEKTLMRACLFEPAGQLCGRLKAGLTWLASLAVMFLFTLAPTAVQAQCATTHRVVVMVNGQPINSCEVEQRQRFLAISSGFGDEMQKQMQAVLKSPEINAKFRAFVESQPTPPSSQEDVKELQRAFVQSLQKQIQQRVLSGRVSAMRETAINDLIEEKLMLQDAKTNNIVVNDDEVMQSLTRKSEDGKTAKGPEDLFQQLRGLGVDPSTYIEKKRAQIAWAQLIRKVYGYRIQTITANLDEEEEPVSSKDALYDVRVLRISLPANADQKTIGRLWNAADNLRQRVSSCDAVERSAKAMEGASVRAMTKAAAASFKPDARALIVKTADGQMTPPVIFKDAIEAYAVCRKHAPAADKKEKGLDKASRRQEEFQIYSRRHLKDLKDKAHIEYRKAS
jgi:peptidyl-prolyl cis-trans isomerase SurA